MSDTKLNIWLCIGAFFTITFWTLFIMVDNHSSLLFSCDYEGVSCKSSEDWIDNYFCGHCTKHGGCNYTYVCMNQVIKTNDGYESCCKHKCQNVSIRSFNIYCRL